MNKHTPGPWNLADSDLPVSQVAVASEKTFGRKHSTIARVVDPAFVGMSSTEGIANARLIAAAPEMLAALQDIIARLSPLAIHESHFAMTRAAIAKATGEPL